MKKLRNQIITVSVLGVGVLILLAGVLVDIRPALAQTSNTCATGTAIPDPANNPGLVSDCEALLASRDALAGTADVELVGGCFDWGLGRCLFGRNTAARIQVESL